MEGLGISLPVLLSQIVTIVILFGLLYLVAYKPVMRMLDERSRRIKESMEQVEMIKEEAAHAEAGVKKQLEEAGRQGQAVVARAARAGEEVREKAQAEAKQDAENIVARAKAEIQRERDEAIVELRKEVADLTIMVAEKVIERSLDKQAHRELIDKVLEESTTPKKG